jgi:hypothetical protein
MKKLLIILFIFLSATLQAQIIRTSANYVSTIVYTPEALTFTTTGGNFTEVSAGLWWSGRWTGDLGYGVDSKALTGDGWIEFEYNSAVNYGSFIGLSSNNTANEALTDPWDYTIEISYPNSRVDAYSTSWSDGSVLVATPTTGDKYRLKRTGSTITGELYRAGAWSVIKTFTATTSATLYLKGTSYCHTETNGKLLNPKGANIF